MASPRTVLLVDDNVEFAELLGGLFEEQSIRPLLARSAADALRLLKRNPDAMILDLLLPDLAGPRLVQRMAAQGPLPPLFVVTGVFRGQAQSEKVAALHPYEGWFEKPFDTRLLVEAVAKKLGVPVVNRAAHARAGRVTPEFDVELILPKVKEPSDDISIEVVSESGTLGEEPTDRGATELVLIGQPRPSVSADVRGDPFEDFSSGFGKVGTPSPSEVSRGLRGNLRQGDLTATSLPRLVAAFFVAQESGEIACEKGVQRKIIFFEAGRPIGAASNQGSDRIGAWAHRVAGLDETQLQPIVARSKAERRPVGELLIEAGLMDRRQRDEILREQLRGIVRSLFSWNHGRYVLGFSASTRIERVELPEHPGALVLAGVRQVFDRERLQSLLPDDLRLVPAPQPVFGLYELPLTDPEASLLLAVDGHRPVVELMSLSGMDERAARATLYALWALGVLMVA